MGESEVLVRLAGELQPESVGREFLVTVIRPGVANGLEYTVQALEACAEKFNLATVFCNHPDALDLTRAGERRIEDIAGVLWNARYGVGGVRAVLTCRGPKADLVRALASQIIRDREAGEPVPNVGLSADMFVRLASDGKTVEEISRVVSVDVVFNPAAGGNFERVLNVGTLERSNVQTKKEGGSKVSEGQSGVVGGGVGLGGAGQGSAGVVAEGAAAIADVRATLAELKAAREQAEKLAQEQLRASCAGLLEASLQASKLPEAMKDEVREAFKGRVFTAEELKGALDRKEQVYARLVETSVIRGMGYQGPVVRGMKDSLDRIQAAANMLLGVPVPDNLKDTPRLSGIRELYIMLTGDWDFYGKFFPDRVQLANISTSTMTSVVKNAMNVALIESFNLQPQWWKPIAHEEDFGTIDQVTWVTLGGFGDLPTVSEGAAYTELSFADNEETASFVKKGGYVGLTLEMIDRDRVAAVRAIPRKIGLAAWRTLSTLVSNLFTDNSGVGPTLSDSIALFHTSHGNLATAALSYTSWDACVQAVYQQAEQNSAKPIGIRPAYCLVPIELENTALTLFLSELLPGSANNDKNVRMMPQDRVITVPEWTDSNNWAAAADPNLLAGVCIGYRFGRVPEIFVADDALTGSMFTNDEMRIKARFTVAVGIGDYRALYKSNVP
jgi:hypothetical protein